LPLLQQLVGAIDHVERACKREAGVAQVIHVDEGSVERPEPLALRLANSSLSNTRAVCLCVGSRKRLKVCRSSMAVASYVMVATR
jgi:hypothetical protein